MKKLVFFILVILAVKCDAQLLLSKQAIMQDSKFTDSLNFYDITYLSDGLKVKGFIIEPKHGKQLPVVIFNRGGNSDYAMIDHRLIEEWMAPVAKAGYIVVASQYRGSPGSEGKDEMGGNDVNDVLNLLPIISTLPNADFNRIGMYGWSRGGIMTYRAIAKTNKIKTAIVGAAPTDLERENKRRPGMDSLCCIMIPGYKTNRKAAIEERSVIYWREKLNRNTSLLILHGTADWRVDYMEAQRLADKLEQLKHPHTLRLFTGDDHGISKNRKERDSMVLEWLKEHL